MRLGIDSSNEIHSTYRQGWFGTKTVGRRAEWKFGWKRSENSSGGEDEGRCSETRSHGIKERSRDDKVTGPGRVRRVNVKGQELKAVRWVRQAL